MIATLSDAMTQPVPDYLAVSVACQERRVIQLPAWKKTTSLAGKSWTFTIWGKTMAKCAFIGLGIMGYPMAGHLKAKGHDVTVYNRTRAKADKWAAEHGGSAAATPREAAEGAEFVMACVGNDDDIRSIAYGDDGLFAGIPDGATFVDHTTASADIARELEAHAKDSGKKFIDAPVSGGQAGAENGALTVMCGGDQAVFDGAKPVIDSYARAVTLLGAAGAGQLTKMVNQICIAGLVQGLSEAINLARRSRHGKSPGRDLQGSCTVLANGEPWLHHGEG